MKRITINLFFVLLSFIAVCGVAAVLTGTIVIAGDILYVVTPGPGTWDVHMCTKLDCSTTVYEFPPCSSDTCSYDLQSYSIPEGKKYLVRVINTPDTLAQQVFYE